MGGSTMAVSGITTIASTTPLKAANEQPHLALELIQRVIQGMQGGGSRSPAVQTPVKPVSPSPSVGQNIDIYA